ncbi:MAG: MBL fold metallo-hydrolase [Bryobacterales bacterium]|nr:MBL fold metallo-hydrolase [Bryobacterales bacterium]
MTYRIAFVALACLGGVGVAAAAQPQPVPLSAQPLKGGVYWVKGGNGANTGFIVGAKEVVVIDAKTVAESSQAMLAEIRKVTPNPVTTVILTHSDGDHVNGLAGLPQGLTIIAHSNTKKDMVEAFKDPKMSALLPYLPTRTVDGDQSLNIGGVRLNLRYFGPAHTSGDLVVLIPRQRIAFIGDLAFLGRDPLIHRQKGGTSLGLVQNLRKILALDADTFISGHNDPLTKADIRGLLTSIEEKQAKVKALIGQGKSLDEIKTAFGLTEPADPSARRRPGLVEIIYLDLK